MFSKIAGIVSINMWLIVAASSGLLFGSGEPGNGFPSWSERVLHQWVNRARSDRQFEMPQCGSNCGAAACYSPMPPLGLDVNLSRAARFHAEHMGRGGYFAH